MPSAFEVSRVFSLFVTLQVPRGLRAALFPPGEGRREGECWNLGAGGQRWCRGRTCQDSPSPHPVMKPPEVLTAHVWGKTLPCSRSCHSYASDTNSTKCFFSLCKYTPNRNAAATPWSCLWSQTVVDKLQSLPTPSLCQISATRLERATKAWKTPAMIWVFCWH